MTFDLHGSRGPCDPASLLLLLLLGGPHALAHLPIGVLVLPGEKKGKKRHHFGRIVAQISCFLKCGFSESAGVPCHWIHKRSNSPVLWPSSSLTANHGTDGRWGGRSGRGALAVPRTACRGPQSLFTTSKLIRTHKEEDVCC